MSGFRGRAEVVWKRCHFRVWTHSGPAAVVVVSDCGGYREAVLFSLTPSEARTGLGRIHALGLEHGSAGRTGQEFDQRFGRCRIHAHGSDADREDYRTVQITGQRADHLSPRNRGNFRGLCDPHFDLALRDEFARLGTRHQDGLGFHLIGDAETIDDLGEIDATSTALRWIGVGDRFGGEKRTLQFLRRADIRLGRTRTYPDGDIRAPTLTMLPWATLP